MQQRYFICGDKLMALNAKAATSTFARAIIKKYHKDIDAEITSAAYPDNQTADDKQWQMIVPYRINPDRPVVCLVRDPVDRFRAAMAQCGLSEVDATIAELHAEAGTYGLQQNVKLVANVHFVPQSRIAGDPIHYFRFPDQIDTAAEFLGLDLPLITINEGTGVKPEVTEAQAEAIRAFYADDVALWNSLQ
jgi:hypothetical protein